MLIKNPKQVLILLYLTKIDDKCQNWQIMLVFSQLQLTSMGLQLAQWILIDP